MIHCIHAHPPRKKQRSRPPLERRHGRRDEIREKLIFRLFFLSFEANRGGRPNVRKPSASYRPPHVLASPHSLRSCVFHYRMPAFGWLRGMDEPRPKRRIQWTSPYLFDDAGGYRQLERPQRPGCFDYDGKLSYRNDEGRRLLHRQYRRYRFGRRRPKNGDAAMRRAKQTALQFRRIQTGMGVEQFVHLPERSRTVRYFRNICRMSEAVGNLRVRKLFFIGKLMHLMKRNRRRFHRQIPLLPESLANGSILRTAKIKNSRFFIGIS